MLGLTTCKFAALGLICVAVLTVPGLTSARLPQAASEGNPFIAGIWESTVDLSQHGTTSHSCILVFPDGRFHLERKVQHLPASTASVSIFDYSLDTSQLGQLRRTLDDEKIRHLPAYTLPTLPMGVPWSHGLNVKIARAGGLQEAGYLTWRGGTAEVSPNSAPENIKKKWQESETALQALVDWFHSIEGLKLTPSDTSPSGCTTDANSGPQ
jgi:hypothetical protein